MTYSILPSSVRIDLPEPLAVVCHDAGATNLIISWLKHYGNALQACMQGPASLLWANAFPDMAVVSLKETLRHASALLSGTGWGSDIEHQARKLACVQGIRSIAVIDHWVNYRERFIRNDEFILPDEIWVADNDAWKEVRRCFPKMPIRQLPNLYLEELVQEVRACNPEPARETPQKVLYVLEPIRQKWPGNDQPGELQAFEFFMNYLSAIGAINTAQIRLRPHPSDSPGKYDGWPIRFPRADVIIDTKGSLSKQIAWADWVVGCQSFALVIALHAKRIVISSLPPWAPSCGLPHRHLRHLRDLVRTTT